MWNVRTNKKNWLAKQVFFCVDSLVTFLNVCKYLGIAILYDTLANTIDRARMSEWRYLYLNDAMGFHHKNCTDFVFPVSQCLFVYFIFCAIRNFYYWLTSKCRKERARKIKDKNKYYFFWFCEQWTVDGLRYV